MTPVLAWMLGWTAFAAVSGVALFYAQRLGPFGTLALAAVAGIAGMTWAAWQAALVRRPDDETGARRQAVAWAVAGVLAFGLFALSLGSPRRPAGQLSSEALSVIRLFVWFGAVGGFLAVAASAGWSLPFRVFLRCVLAAVVWSGLLLASGVGAFLGLYVLGSWFDRAMGPAGFGVAAILTGLASGLFLGQIGEETNRRTFRFSG